MSATDFPRGESGPRYVRLQVELVLEITAAAELRAAALARIADDAFMPREERAHAEAAVGADESEALAYLVDPSELVADLAGTELVQASWSCAHTEYDPDAWTSASDDFDDDFDADPDADPDGGSGEDPDVDGASDGDPVHDPDAGRRPGSDRP